MKTNKTIEGTGYFWFPGETDKRLPGILRILPTGSAELRLTDLKMFQLPPTGELRLGEPLLNPGQTNYPVIVGIVDIGKTKLVTLKDCIRTNWSEPFTSGIVTLTIIARYIFLGDEHNDDRENYSKLQFSLTGLDDWLGVSGIETTIKRGEKKLHSATIKFTPPDERTYSLPDGFEFEFNFGYTIPGFRISEAKISQKAYISLKSKELRSLDEFLAQVWKIQQFFCFCVDTTVSVESITAYSTEFEHPEQPFEIHCNSMHRADIVSQPSRYKMLLTYDLLEKQFENVLLCWFDDYDRYKPAYDLYFSTKFVADNLIESKFLSIVQCIEALHRKAFQETEMSSDEHERIINAMLETVPTKRQEFFKTKLKYSNGLTLRKGLKKLFGNFESLYGTNIVTKDQIDKIVRIRNDLTHLCESPSAKGVAAIEELVQLQQKLEALFQLHLLKIIGLDSNVIEKIANDGNKSLYWKIGSSSLQTPQS